MTTTHIVGSGMAGLACAIETIRLGGKVCLYESSDFPGGRCRSFYDQKLDCLIDNGNHLIIGANPAVFNYLTIVKNLEGLVGQKKAAFSFINCENREVWKLQPSSGPIPWWTLHESLRPPGTSFADYFGIVRLACAKKEATVADCVGSKGKIITNFWAPLSEAILNASVSEGSAQLLWQVLKRSFGKGEKLCRAYQARTGLGPDLIDPGIKYITDHGQKVLFNSLLKEIVIENNSAKELNFNSFSVDIKNDDKLILAIPPFSIEKILPSISVPQGSRAILNIHFKLNSPGVLPSSDQFIGVIGGTSHWIFVRNDIVSVTVSAANKLMKMNNESIIELIWKDVATALKKPPSEVPPSRVIKEKRATFAQTPSELKNRPDTQTSYKNIFLAGDWTNTGLPATIEGAIRSGYKAAKAAIMG